MKAFIDGNDIVMTDVFCTCWGGPHDPDDNGETESGVSTLTPGVMGVALPVRSTEAATSGSILSAPDKAHIPWGTTIQVSRPGSTAQGRIVLAALLDNGPDVRDFPTHYCDVTPAVAELFDTSDTPENRLPLEFGEYLDIRIMGGAEFVDVSKFPFELSR